MRAPRSPWRVPRVRSGPAPRHDCVRLRNERQALAFQPSLATQPSYAFYPAKAVKQRAAVPEPHDLAAQRRVQAPLDMKIVARHEASLDATDVDQHPPVRSTLDDRGNVPESAKGWLVQRQTIGPKKHLIFSPRRKPLSQTASCNQILNFRYKRTVRSLQLV